MLQPHAEPITDGSRSIVTSSRRIAHLRRFYERVVVNGPASRPEQAQTQIARLSGWIAPNAEWDGTFLRWNAFSALENYDTLPATDEPVLRVEFTPHGTWHIVSVNGRPVGRSHTRSVEYLVRHFNDIPHLQAWRDQVRLIRSAATGRPAPGQVCAVPGRSADPDNDWAFPNPRVLLFAKTCEEGRTVAGARLAVSDVLHPALGSHPKLISVEQGKLQRGLGQLAEDLTSLIYIKRRKQADALKDLLAAYKPVGQPVHSAPPLSIATPTRVKVAEAADE
jgi:hypothetical protein